MMLVIIRNCGLDNVIAITNVIKHTVPKGRVIWDCLQ